MVQLFSDRMRWEGGGLRGLAIWAQTLTDLVGSAFYEHREAMREREERVDMRKRVWIGGALIFAAVAVAAGLGSLFAQSGPKVVEQLPPALQAAQDGASTGAVLSISVLENEKSFVGKGENALADALRQALNDGAISQQSAARIERSFAGSLAIPDVNDGSEKPGNGWRHLTFTGDDGLAETLRQAVRDGVIAQELADAILRDFNSRIPGS